MHASLGTLYWNYQNRLLLYQPPDAISYPIECFIIGTCCQILSSCLTPFEVLRNILMLCILMINLLLIQVSHQSWKHQKRHQEAYIVSHTLLYSTLLCVIQFRQKKFQKICGKKFKKVTTFLVRVHKFLVRF